MLCEVLKPTYYIPITIESLTYRYCSVRFSTRPDARRREYLVWRRHMSRTHRWLPPREADSATDAPVENTITTMKAGVDEVGDGEQPVKKMAQTMGSTSSTKTPYNDNRLLRVMLVVDERGTFVEEWIKR
jgi:hypothetical protein